MTGMLVAFIAAIANVFLQIPALSLTISAVFALVVIGYDYVADQRYYSRRRAQLYLSNRYPVRNDLQPVPEPVTYIWHHERRLSIDLRFNKSPD